MENEKSTRTTDDKTYSTNDSTLLWEYHAAMTRAYDLGEYIKKVYGTMPPKVILNNGKTVSLTVN